MSAITVLIKNNLTETDWDNYKKLWQTADAPNPFIAPKQLQAITKTALNVAFVFSGEEIIGAIPFFLANGKFALAGEEKSDAIHLLFKTNTPTYIKQQSIEATFKQLKVSSLFAGKLIENRFDYLLFIYTLKKLGYKFATIKSTKNPVVKFSKNQYSPDEFLKIFSKRNTRNYCNKLSREFGYSITAIETFDAVEVEKWLNTFFTFHITRWGATNTPSMYANAAMRTWLYNKVKLWLEENVGLLFSIDVNQQPMAMAVCLKNGESIIYHQISSSNDETLSKYPKQKILILELAKWIIDNGYKSIDFGVGVEPYKYEYANKDPNIIRLYAAKSITSKTYIKGAIDYHYQKSPQVRNFINNKVRIFITKAKSKLNGYKSKLRYTLGELKTDKNFISKKIKIATQPDTQYFYKFIPNKISLKPISEVTYGIGNVYDVIAFYEKEIVFTAAKKHYYFTTMAENNKTPHCLYTKDKKIASIAWMTSPNEDEMPNEISLNNPQVIIDCFTAKEQRGKGYYAYLLNTISAMQSGDVMIYTNDWNVASQKGIAKAGFEHIATRVLKKGEKDYEWLPNN